MVSSYLLSSRVEVQRPVATMVDGVLTSSYETVAGLESVPLRIEVGFLRPGRDAPLPVQAGRAPDRIALCWGRVGLDVRSGDRLVCVSGPVTGTWELRVDPDPAVGMRTARHIEFQVVEVTPETTGEML